MDFSVIIPAYNEEKCLPETLEKTAKSLSLAPCHFEIIVVDNDSRDRTKQIAESFGVKVLDEKEHCISKVRNRGAANSKGDLLIFIDADTIVSETLFQEIASAMEDEKCLGGAVAIEYEEFKSKWVKNYLLLCRFIGRLFDMKQGATQFCRKSAFEELQGYDQSIFMGEDVEFYWRLSKFAKQKAGYLCFVENPKVITSSRKFNKMGLWKTILFTHPVFMYFTFRKKFVWKDWYENAVR